MKASPRQIGGWNLTLCLVQVVQLGTLSSRCIIGILYRAKIAGHQGLAYYCLSCNPHGSVLNRHTVGSRKYAPFLFLHTTLRQKWGGGVCSDIQFAYAPPSIPTRKIDNHNECCGFLEEWQLHWICTTENQGHLSSYYAKRHQSNFHRNCHDRGRPWVSSHSQCEQHKNLNTIHVGAKSKAY